MRRLAAILAVLHLGALPAAAAEKKVTPVETAAAAKVSFQKDVQPILKQHCLGCHAGAKPKGRLSMESVADLLKGGRTGPALLAGKPDDSLLIKAISGPEPSMPKKEPPLTADKVRVLRLWILAGARDDGSASIAAIEIRAPQTYTFAPAVTSVALSADGKLLAAACRSEVVLIDVDGKAPPRRLPTASDLLSQVEFSPDGKLLAAAGGTPGRYGEVRFFDPATGQVVSTRRVGKDTLFRGHFAPDGKALAVGGTDGAVHVVPVDVKQPVRRFELHSDWIHDVAYTPDGKMLVTGGRDKTSKVADARTGELLRTLDTSADIIRAVAADNLSAVAGGRARTLVGYDFKIALTGIKTGGKQAITRPNQYARPFEGQAGEVLDLGMSGDRKLVASAGNFGDVRVYRMDNRQRVALIPNVPAPVYAVALDGKGTRLALGTKGGLVQVYQLPAGKLVKSLVPVPVATPPRGTVKK